MSIELGQTFWSKKDKRDAIHIAVAAVTCGEKGLKAGDHIGFLPNGKVGKNAEKLIGIVDPFLSKEISLSEDRRFYICLYPNSVIGMKHHWIHPAFMDKDESKKWIENFARLLRKDYQELMYDAKRFMEHGDLSYDNSENYKDYWEEFEEFWIHYEVVEGKTVYNKECFYTCSC